MTERLDQVDLRILGCAYESWFERREDVSRNDLMDSVVRAMVVQGPFDGIPDLDERIERLAYHGLLIDDGHSYLILPAGCRAVEEAGTASAELCAAVRQARVDVLEGLGVVRASRGIDSSVHYSNLADNLNLAQNLVSSVLFQLEKDGLIDRDGNAGMYGINQSGLIEIRELAAGRKQVDEYTRVSNLDPHPRGRQLQKYLADLIASQGWRVEEGARTSNEEMDVVVSLKREVFVLECKWENVPSEAKYVHTLKGKLDNRADVRGILVSMSGFTKGALEQIRHYVGSRIILPFGRGDVESMVNGVATFEAILDAKYHRLVINRVTVVDGEESGQRA